MKNSDISDLLMRFVEGGVKEWEFDDLLSRSQNGILEEYRIELINIKDFYPSEDSSEYCNKDGLNRIAIIADEISKIQ